MLARMIRLEKQPSLGPTSGGISPSRRLIQVAGCQLDSCPLVRTTGNRRPPRGGLIAVGNVTHATQSSGAAAGRDVSSGPCR
jgi:hypothetical protein